MRKLLFALLLLAAGVVALGVYLGWFHFSTGGKDSGKIDANLTIDSEKIKADAEKAREKAKALGSQAKAKIEGGKAKEPDKPTPPKD